MRSFARAPSRILLGLALLSGAQVFLLRWIDPPATWTMLERAWDASIQDGRPVWVFRAWRDLPAVGPNLPRAAIAAEDARFFEHHGFDVEGIRRAVEAYRASQPGEPLRGGSTITQQVAKNVFLWQDQTWLRKGLEVWFTLLLELMLPKERILELYLNVAETGPRCFGVEAGARRWFGKSAASLSASEAATLLALFPSPNRWTPEDLAVQRRARAVERAMSGVQLPVSR
jgi:monofunctional biosynthetic peptidoglycan transglycosylase